MKIKRILTLVLVFSMVISMTSVASATDTTPNSMLEKAEEQFVEKNYEKYTITMDTSEKLDAKNSRAMIALSEKHYNQAVQFVNSLDLADHPDVKEENLKYLEELHKAGANITSHTVLVPRDEGLYTYGTHNGMTYFYKYYANTVYEVLKDDTQGTTILQNLKNGIVDFIVELCGNEPVTFIWNAIRLALDLPASHTVQSGDFIEYKVKVNTTLRGIYTQDLFKIYGLYPSVIVRVYTGEAGAARAYMVYHHGTVSGNPETANWIGDPQYISTQDYYDKEATMELAEMLYFGGGDGHHYLTDVVIYNSDLYFG